MPARILLLANVNSAHTLKLAKGVADAGFDTGVFTLFPQQKRWFATDPRIQVFDDDALPEVLLHAPTARKLVYLRKITALKRLIREFRPQIVHAHYATSYGLLGWLSGFHPLVISVWGSDILNPRQGKLARTVLRSVLKSADQLMVTSHTLQAAVAELCGRTSMITPFGVDTRVFRKRPEKRPYAPGTLVFGSIKTLESVYRIDVLITAFARLKRSFPDRRMHLLLVGDGTQREALLHLAREQRLVDAVTFAGQVDPTETPRYHNMIDVLVNISAYEGFGVTVLEAMACGRPVIVTDTGGLAEIVDQGVTGIRVPVDDVRATADAMQRLLLSEELRLRMGENGQQVVMQRYEWQKTIDLITANYTRLLSS